MKYLILLLVLSGCSTGAIKMMKSNQEGGRIMLVGSNTWMEPNSRKKADAEMIAKCPNGYSIVEEGLMERPSSDMTLTRSTHIMEKYLEFKCK